MDVFESPTFESVHAEVDHVPLQWNCRRKQKVGSLQLLTVQVTPRTCVAPKTGASNSNENICQQWEEQEGEEEGPRSKGEGVEGATLLPCSSDSLIGSELIKKRFAEQKNT